MPPANSAIKRSLSRTRLEVIEAFARICQLLGIPRSLGQIYGLLYLAPDPLSLDQISDQLGISKASASTGTRQLTAWGGIREVWVPGERRDHFQIEPEFDRLFKSFYSDLVKPRLAASETRFSRIAVALEEDLRKGFLTREEHKLCSGRLKKLNQVQKKIQSLAPLAEKLL
jgi:HTH-type transcriptional regulator, glycine betaine synthesis regulator